MLSVCVHIQTYSRHFKYTDNLINSFLSKTNLKQLNIPIYITFDNQIELKKYINEFKYQYDKLHLLNLETIVNNLHIDIKEKHNDLYKDNIGFTWGAGGHRNHVGVKRVYSILELHKNGFDYVWCLDCESLILKNIDLMSIFSRNMEKPLLTIGNSGVKYPEMITKLFMDDYNKYKHISVRQNDFWFIHTKHFYDMIAMLIKIHKKPISFFITGSEQSVYEYYIYSLYIRNKNDVNILQINGDLHGNTLFNNIIQNTKINIKDYCDSLNKTYFDYIKSYRGDYYKECLKTQRGRELVNALNVSICVSNYQGF